MTKKNDQAIKEARKKLKDAEEKQAVGAEFAPDYMDLQGVRFFKPKVAHTWLFDRLQHSVDGFASLNDFGACLVYALAHTQNDVRSKIMPEITRRQIVDRANDFIIENELTKETIEEVLKTYAYKVLNISTEDKGDEEETSEKKEVADQELNLSGGQK